LVLQQETKDSLPKHSQQKYCGSEYINGKNQDFYCGKTAGFGLVWSRQAMFLGRNIEARSCNHYCSGETVLLILRVCL
jgi:hypothetical protein